MANGEVHVTSNGKRWRTSKRYVDVLLRNSAAGEIYPYAICWVDGRCWYIDEILDVTLNGGKSRIGRWEWSRVYEIRISDHVTQLYEEQYGDNPGLGELSYKRWWVHARDYVDVLKNSAQGTKRANNSATHGNADYTRVPNWDPEA